MRKHSFVFLPCLCKKQADTNCKASLAYWFRDNLFGFDAAWLVAIILSHKYGFYLLICLHIALKILEIHAGISALFALSENKSVK